ncbi:hypothetical protein M3194_25190 [Paenibacillus glycanilyticus]|uniref:hypothetical protein n=1 Tax=Paenibacillus glycanilyticus TaxID=126569 RepID=UPI00203AF588|nr:hypothetical protein [Paenibacillus glycanilyticus]MCM3630631.1 hypothetical protein [Paenibacillus glycanilyticus]
MRFADTTAGVPYAKDPAVVRYKGKYWMYYSRGPFTDGRWGIGIAESSDLEHWTKVGKETMITARPGICPRRRLGGRIAFLM